MHDDIHIIERFSQRPPFAALDCAHALGIEVLYSPSASATTCQVSLGEDRRLKRRMTLPADLLSKADHAQRFAISVGIGHFVLHQDLMMDEVDGEATFNGFVDTGLHLSALCEARARRYALMIMAPSGVVGAIAAKAASLEDAIDQVASGLSIPRAAADITLASQGHKARFQQPSAPG